MNKGKIITGKKYHLLRFSTYDDNLINWNESDKVMAELDAGIPHDFLIFPEIAFKRSFLISSFLKNELGKNDFRGSNLYSLKEFAEGSQRRIKCFRKKENK